MGWPEWGPYTVTDPRINCLVIAGSVPELVRSASYTYAFRTLGASERFVGLVLDARFCCLKLKVDSAIAWLSSAGETLQDPQTVARCLSDVLLSLYAFKQYHQKHRDIDTPADIIGVG